MQVQSIVTKQGFFYQCKCMLTARPQSQGYGKKSTLYTDKPKLKTEIYQIYQKT